MIRFHFLDAAPCDRTLRRLAKQTPLNPPALSWAALFGVAK
jgi:hypothetical protein